MKKHFTKSLTVIFAVLGVYFVAFKVLITVNVGMSWKGRSRPSVFIADHRPRWDYPGWVWKAMRVGFAPLISIERRFRGMEDWELDGPVPEPDWVKEYRSKP